MNSHAIKGPKEGFCLLTKHHSQNLKIPLSLSWFRVVAALCVFFSHSKLHWFGGQGSVFFMVISGYIFTRLFLKTEVLDKKHAVGDFLKGRLQKVIPPLFCVLLFNVSYKMFFGIPFDFIQILSIFTFTSNYYNAYFSHPDNGLSHLWTLSLIVQFYLFWSLSFSQLIKRPNPRHSMSLFLITIILAVMFYRSYMELSGVGSYGYIFNTFETRADAMAIGALLAVNIDGPFCTSLLEKFSSFNLFVISIVGLAMTGLQSLSFRNTVGFDLHSICVCFLILSLVGFEDKESSFKPQSFERASYAAYISFLFYLLHPWALSLGNKLPISDAFQVLIGAFMLIIVLKVVVDRKKVFKQIIQRFSRLT